MLFFPEFHWFAEETVLLGHNLAFDMKMLGMKENSSGIKFTHPVLDTLLLKDAIEASKTTYLSRIKY